MEKAMWTGKKHQYKNNGTIVVFTSIDRYFYYYLFKAN